MHACMPHAEWGVHALAEMHYDTARPDSCQAQACTRLALRPYGPTPPAVTETQALTM